MRQLKITKSITNRESASLDKYLQEIATRTVTWRGSRLATGLKKGIVRRWKKKSPSQPPFRCIGGKAYQTQGLSLPDLINEGNWDWLSCRKVRRTRFSIYQLSVWWIVNRSCRHWPSNRVSCVAGIRWSLNKIAKLSDIWTGEWASTFSRRIALALELSVDKVTDLTEGVSVATSSWMLPLWREDHSLLDVLVNDDAPIATGHDQESLQKEIDRALSTSRAGEWLIWFFCIGGRRWRSKRSVTSSTDRERCVKLKKKRSEDETGLVANCWKVTSVVFPALILEKG